MKHFDVVGIGASTIDIITLVDHFPKGREVQRAIDLVVQGGGPVATALAAMSRLGAKSAMIDVIGDDWTGRLIKKEFQADEVDTSLLVVREGYSSSTSCILVSQENGDRSIIYYPGSIPELSLNNEQKSAIQSAKILHINGRHWEACLEAVKLAHDMDVLVSFDGGADRYTPEMKQLVPFTDICIVARDFAQKYTGEPDVKKAAEILEKGGPRLVVITDGVRGSWIRARGGKNYHQPAFLFPKTIDTTGCGDSYHGAFLFGLANHWDLEKISPFASAVAALNSQSLGGRSGIPNVKQVADFLHARGAIARIVDNKRNTLIL